MQLARAAFFATFLLAVLVLVGCDGARVADVKGSVKYDGQIIDEGAIAFYPVDGKSPSEGGSVKNGQYAARVPIGAMKVTISWPKPFGPKKKLYENDPNSPEIALKKESLPEKYSSQAATELTFDVKAGMNQKDWDLSK